MSDNNFNAVPKAVGPYKTAVFCGNILFCSGQIPLDPQTGEIVGTNTTDQCEQVMKNIVALLQSYNLTLQNVRKTMCFLQNMNDFAVFNEVYARYFTEPYPARSCVEVSRLPKDVLVEIEVIAER